MATWKWFKATNATGMIDVAAAVNAGVQAIVTVGADGRIWRMTNWNHFVPDAGTADFRRVARSPDGAWLYGAGANGTVWYSKAPGQWTEFMAARKLGAPVEDLVLAYDNSLWVTLSNGQMWSIRDGEHWEWRTVLNRFKRLAAGPGNHWWGVDDTGALWFRDASLDDEHSYWRETRGAGVEDITVDVDGTVYTVGTDGTVWKTRDGQSVTQIVDASGFFAVSAQASDFLWSVGRNGTFWVYQRVPDAGGGGGGGGGGRVDTKLHLRLTDTSAQFDVQSVQWFVYLQSLAQFTLVASPTGEAADLNLPGNGQYHVRAQVGVRRLATGDVELAEFRGNGGRVENMATLVFSWSGAAQTNAFRLISEGAGAGLYNPVVLT